jgi:hypothetical protein
VLFRFLHRLEYLALFRATSMMELPRPGLQTEPRNSDPTEYVGMGLQEILKPLY